MRIDVQYLTPVSVIPFHIPADLAFRVGELVHMISSPAMLSYRGRDRVYAVNSSM